MGYATHIGRVGALAVAIGVGVAVASTPGIAYAQPSDSDSVSSSTDDSSTTAASPSAEGASPGQRPVPGNSDGTDTQPEASEPATEPESTESPSRTVRGGGGAPGVVIRSSGGAHTATTDDSGAEDISPALDDDDSSPAAGDDGPAETSGSEDESGDNSPGRRHSTVPAGESGEAALAQSGVPEDPEVVAAEDEQSDSVGHARPALPLAALAPGPSGASAAASASDDALAPASVGVVPAAPVPTVWDIAGGVVDTVVTVASQMMSAVVTQLLDPAPGSTDSPLMWLMAAFARKEFETFLAPAQSEYYAVNSDGTRTALSAAAAASLLADPNTHVLVLGVDGTNLARILADDYNQAFFALMNQGTTAASTIVGHTTISNPSWTTILTGVWSERAGVINNIFTPWTYDTWLTVFNHIEGTEPSINTTMVADWDVITKIAGAGAAHADKNIYVTQVPGDDAWEATTAKVGDAAVQAIKDTVTGEASFQFTYFTGVDINGHDNGGASPEYASHIRLVNDQIARIMAAVNEREQCPGLCEKWTVIVTTDHGHQPQLGLGHGFQSPNETSTFVIARDTDGTIFTPGTVNNSYVIADVTPTVLALLGLTPPAYMDGVPLMDKAANTYTPVDDPGLTDEESLHQALLDAIAQYGYPDINTQVALAIRTLFGFPPYQIFNTTRSIAGQVPSFLSPVVLFFGAVLYQSFNIPAQYVARLTGVYGNQLIPPDLWPFTPLPEGTISTLLPSAFLTANLSDGSVVCTVFDDAGCAA